MAVKSNLTNMALCLTAVCLVCSALLGGMYVLTAEPIAKANADILKASIGAVLPEGGELSEAKTIQVGGQPSEYYVSTEGGSVKAYAVKSTVVGYGRNHSGRNRLQHLRPVSHRDPRPWSQVHL